MGLLRFFYYVRKKTKAPLINCYVLFLNLDYVAVNMKKWGIIWILYEIFKLFKTFVMILLE